MHGPISSRAVIGAPHRSGGVAYARRVSQTSAAMSIAIRRARPADAEALQYYYETLSPRSRFQRFHGAVNALPAPMVARFAANDRPDERTLLAVLVGGASEAIVGEARYVVAQDGRRAEFALSVADAAQGIGIGRRLVQRLMQEAQVQGIDTFQGEVMPENDAMLALAQTLGFDESRSGSDARLRRIERKVRRPQVTRDVAGFASDGTEMRRVAYA